MSDIEKFRSAMLQQNFQRAEFIIGEIGLKAPKIAKFLNALVAIERGEPANFDFEPQKIKNKNIQHLASIFVAEHTVSDQTKVGIIDPETSATHVFNLEQWVDSVEIISKTLFVAHTFGHIALLDKILDRWRKIVDREAADFHAEFLTQFYMDLIKNEHYDLANKLISMFSNRTLDECSNNIATHLYNENDSKLGENREKIEKAFAKLFASDLFDSKFCKKLLWSFTKRGNLRHFILNRKNIIENLFENDLEIRFLLNRVSIEVTLDKKNLNIDTLTHDLFLSDDFVTAAKLAYHLPFVSASIDQEIRWSTGLRCMWGRLHSKPFERTPAIPKTDQPYKLTFTSFFLRNHGIGHALSGFVEHFKDHGFVYDAMNLGKEVPDDQFQATIKKHAQRWYTGKNSTEFESHDLEHGKAWLRDGGSDAIINLDGLMDPSSLELLNHDESSLSIYWIGHGGKLNLPFVDYTIVDPFVCRNYPLEFGEKEIRLPKSFVSFGPIEYNKSLTKKDFGISKDTFVYLCFNNPIKVTREYIECIAEISKRLDHRVLFWFNYGERAEFVWQVKRELIALGLPGKCLRFGVRLEPKSTHFARLAVSDVALDTFAVNMASGALDSMWAGTPVVSLVGENYTSRICGSFNQTIGLGEFNVHSREEYIDRAVQLAVEPRLLADAKDHLLSVKDECSLFNGSVFAKELCSGLRLAIDRSRRGEKPMHIDVPAQ